MTNEILPLAYVTSYSATYLSLLKSKDKLFALANLLVMFLPLRLQDEPLPCRPGQQKKCEHQALCWLAVAPTIPLQVRSFLF